MVETLQCQKRKERCEGRRKLTGLGRLQDESLGLALAPRHAGDPVCVCSHLLHSCRVNDRDGDGFKVI